MTPLIVLHARRLISALIFDNETVDAFKHGTEVSQWTTSFTIQHYDSLYTSEIIGYNGVSSHMNWQIIQT